jgi:prepilin-type N-terminal cleavage/methylation domain-containing protein
VTTNPESDRSDDGFTLVELLIAITIMGVAVIVLVVAMSTVVTATSQHRGHAIEETLARNYGEAIQQKADFRTKLTSAVSASATSISVQDAKGFQLGATFYVVIEQETMKVTAVPTATTLIVTRGVGGTAAAHASSTAATALMRCPTASTAGINGYLAPDANHFTPPNEATASIASVEFWNPTTLQFGSQTACTTHFDTICPADIRPECDVGLVRVTVHVTINALYRDRLRDPITDTQILVRRGSA